MRLGRLGLAGIVTLLLGCATAEPVGDDEAVGGAPAGGATGTGGKADNPTGGSGGAAREAGRRALQGAEAPLAEARPAEAPLAEARPAEAPRVEARPAEAPGAPAAPARRCVAACASSRALGWAAVRKTTCARCVRRLPQTRRAPATGHCATSAATRASPSRATPVCRAAAAARPVVAAAPAERVAGAAAPRPAIRKTLGRSSCARSTALARPATWASAPRC